MARSQATNADRPMHNWPRRPAKRCEAMASTRSSQLVSWKRSSPRSLPLHSPRSINWKLEPGNRLVARSLERDWNAKLTEVEQLQREHAALPKPAALLITPQERERILALAQNVPAVWHASTTSQAERKQLLRYLIKDVTLTKREQMIEVRIRWQTEALTDLTVPRPKLVADARRTAPQVVARVLSQRTTRRWALLRLGSGGTAECERFDYC